MINKVISYLQLNNIGFLEIMVALYPILLGYTYGPINGNLLFILLIAFLSIERRKKKINFTWLKILILYIAIHEIMLMFIIPVQSYFINNTFSIIVISLCIMPIARTINFNKFIGAWNLISIICIIGLLYQVMIVMAGGSVSPIKIPFMPDMSSDSRLYEDVVRPSSFFWEPAALVTFLMITLYISLIQKKYIWSIIIMTSMFLSTSSTGILMSFLMLIVYVFTQKNSFKTRFCIIVAGIGLLGLLMTSSFFSAGRDKINNTDPENNARLINGVLLFENLSKTEIILGIDAANVDDYYKKHGNGFYLGDKKIFIPAFWFMLAKYGITGIVLYIWLYIAILRKDKSILPYISVIFISMFFQGISFGNGIFAYQLIFLYSYVNRYKLFNTNKIAYKNESIYSNDTICQ